MDILTCEFVYSSRRLERELNICVHTEFFLVQRTITPLINMQGLDNMSNVEVHLCAPCSCPSFVTMKLWNYRLWFFHILVIVIGSCTSFKDVVFVKISIVYFRGNMVFKVNIKVCCHFIAVFCLVWAQFFSENAWSHFQFLNTSYSLIKSCHAVVLKTPNKWAVKVTDAPSKWAPMISPFFGILTTHSFYPRLVLNTATTLIYNLESIENEDLYKTFTRFLPYHMILTSIITGVHITLSNTGFFLTNRK